MRIGEIIMGDPEKVGRLEGWTVFPLLLAPVPDFARR